MFEKVKYRAVRNFLFYFVAIILVLGTFSMTLDVLLEEAFLINPKLEQQLQLYYLLFSGTLILIFLIIGQSIYKQVFTPIPQVLKRIRDLKNPQVQNQAEVDFLTELPDFWNWIEEEVIEVANSIGKKQKQYDRIRRAIEQILNVFPEPTIIVGADGKINYNNKAFLSSFTELNQTIPTYLADVFREPEVLSMSEPQPDATSFKKEIQIFSKNSDTRKYFTVFKTPFATRNEDGSRDQMMIFHDVTAAKMTDQMKTDFVSNVSHELRTPLTSIKGYVQTLKEDIGAKNFDHTEKFFEIIESHVERLSLLISDLLDLSYLESDNSLQKNKISTKDLTEKILKQFSLDFEKGSYQVEQIYDANMVLAEERLIEQVLINLIQNSLRHTPAKTKIKIEWKKENNKAVLSFKDNGPGISEEHLSRIFERFYRIDPHRSRSRGGTGLGLSIVKHIMHRHEGAIHVSSQQGHGVEFRCIFPDQ